MSPTKAGTKGNAVHVFVDNTNVFLEGRRASAIRLGLPASRKDPFFVIDYGKVLYVVQDGRHLASIPRMYGSEPPPNDSVWKRIRDDGFDLTVFKRNFFRKEKGLDMELGLSISDLIHESRAQGLQPGIVCLVAGDADYVRIVERLRKAKWTAEVWYWNNAAGDLKDAADRFESLNKHIDFIGTRPRPKHKKRHGRGSP
jgi:uncharacterized LabA/DUF88 family protein